MREDAPGHAAMQVLMSVVRAKSFDEMFAGFLVLFHKIIIDGKFLRGASEDGKLMG